jgi:BirA family biotin operon repressor/biotin-[acetyl-CoA-carboxylase] ligase
MATPYSVVRLAVTGSTQDEARSRFTAEPLLVIADAQTAGRGRSGAHWETAPRALAVSLALDPRWPLANWPLLPLVAGVAAARVLDCGLKWPNDLLAGSAKLGGILVEAGNGPLVVGMGVNLWWPRAPAGYGAVWGSVPSDDAGAVLALQWANQMMEMLAAGPGAWPRSEYVKRCRTLGLRIAWDPDGIGRAVDVAGDGALVVETAKGLTSLRSGEVRHVRPVEPGS